LSTFVGVDDTDSAEGMCTTYLGLRMMASLPDGSGLIGLPRLVRLNPNVPWRTRGNGAVAFEVGAGSGEPAVIGGIDGSPILSYPGPSDAAVDAGELLRSLSSIVDGTAHHGRDGTDPGLVVSPGPLPDDLYWTGVRGIHGIDDIRQVLEDNGCQHRSWGNGRGLIGAACAIAWPAGQVTYEAVSYRKRERWGTDREFDAEAFRTLDSEHGTFGSSDPGTGRVLAVPNTPCPVLAGVRADSPGSAEGALLSVRTEESAGHLLWATNHATDDHITSVRSVGEISPYMSVSIPGAVMSAPRTLQGGHVILSMDGGGSIDVAAYEPTKGLRDAVLQLREGDVITAVGGVRETPLTINLEKLRIVRTVDRFIKSENPVCNACGKHMKSKGRGAGYRCQVCGATASENDAGRVSARAPDTGWYEASPSARRHLTMPLERLDRC